jgi:hypothetical protein
MDVMMVMMSGPKKMRRNMGAAVKLARQVAGAQRAKDSKDFERGQQHRELMEAQQQQQALAIRCIKGTPWCIGRRRPKEATSDA